MRNNKKFTAFTIIGIFGSLIVGLALIITGGSTFNFSLAIAGVIVLVCGILLTISIVTIVTVFHYMDMDTVEPEPIHIVCEPHNIEGTPKPKKRTVLDVMDKENAFISGLEQSGKHDLFKQYKAEAELICNATRATSGTKTYSNLTNL